MIKVYLDWNVISGMRNGYLDDFKKIILDRNKFLLLYSTSHIGDIYASFKNRDENERKIIDQDLSYIKSITDGLCVLIRSKQLALEHYDPVELFDDTINSEINFDDFSIDKFFSHFDIEDPFLNKIVMSLVNILKSLPLDPAFADAYKNTDSALQLKKIFPGLEDNRTLDGFFKSFGQMFQNVNDGEDYKTIREVVQRIGVSSGHFNEHKNPFDVINNAYKKMGLEDFSAEKYLESSSVVPKWFDNIINDYLKIDIHGFKSDKIKVTEKEKNTFRNITEDANHAAFASRCEFYVTSDAKNAEKTKVVYEKLGINTIVLKPHEFIEYYNNCLNYHSFLEHFVAVVNHIKMYDGFHLLKYEDGREYGLIKYSHEYFFNFFNEIFIPIDKTYTKAHFVLLKEHPTKDTECFICYEEIHGLVSILVEGLGDDINGNSHLNINEMTDGDNWIGREWQTSSGNIVLCFQSNKYQLYYYLSSEEIQ